MHASEKFWKWYWVPVSVFLIGMVSILLFVGFDRIKNHQIIYSNLIDSILDIEIKTATFHLQLEDEYQIYGGSEDDRGATADIDQAISLAEMVLSTLANSGQRLNPVFAKDPGVLARAEEMKSLLVSLKQKGIVQHQESGNLLADMEFDAAYAVVLAKTAVLGDIVKAARVENRRKMRGLFLGIVLIWTLAVISATGGLWWLEMRRKSTEESLLKVNSQLQIQAEELTAHRENLAGLVQMRTFELTTANDQLRIEIAERLRAEETLKGSDEQIRHLSAQLLRAQEIERKRISMELHDGLGQALNVMKLRIRIVENGLGVEQVAARDECEGLQEYLNEIIEDVRRLSQDLSPAILEDLGLTTALHYLVSNFRTSDTMRLTSDIAELDGLFPENHCITIYRVIQEALTNAGKHSRAGNVSVVIRRHDDRVTFAVQDDGRGFDVNGGLQRDAAKMGLGLMTMNERVTGMGGKFDLWSRAGEGTRIIFSVPAGTGGANNGKLSNHTG